MLLIHTPIITSRIKYIFHLIFNDLLGANASLTDNMKEFNGFAGPKISYGSDRIKDEVFFQSSKLLLETGVRQLIPETISWKGETALFPVNSASSAFPFDPFAASFYLLSRYEELLAHEKDMHGRFKAEDSLAFKKKFLNKPVVNIWAGMIADVLTSKFPEFSFEKKKYNFVSTIDIDIAYAFLERNLYRTGGGLARSFMQFDMSEIALRAKVLAGKSKDPFDTFGYLEKSQCQNKTDMICFFLLGDYDKMSKNISHKSKNLRHHIRKTAEFSDIGIHPSYYSGDDPEKLISEKQRLEEILEKKITKSRQHFLRFEMPHTYRNLILSGITDDYTMGYATYSGFRAGICSTFEYYDIENESKTELRIHPLAMMDGTFIDYMKISQEEAINQISSLIKEVKSVNGTFISLWHNHSLSDYKMWKGWKDVFEKMTNEAGYYQCKSA